jgi:hypothetical protein
MPPRKGRKVAAAADVPPKPSEGAAASGRKRKAGGPKNAQKKGRTSGGAHPTVNEIQNDPLTALANENWAPGVAKGKKFDAALVETIYTDEIAPGKVSRLILLLPGGLLVAQFRRQGVERCPRTFHHRNGWREI